MSDSLDFSIPKDRLILVIICSALMLILLFGVGVATGFLLAGHTPGPKDLHPENEALPKQASKANAPKASAPAPPAAPAGAATAPATATEERLTIQAASFPDEHQASRLAALLQRDGYRPVSTGQDPSSAQTPYYVRLGPYRTWEQASRIATELDRSYDLHTIVKPVRTAVTHS